MANETSKMTLGSGGSKLIHEFEKLNTKMYSNDGAGHCTIGWGHLVHPGKCDGRENEKVFKTGVTSQQADALFKGDVARAETAVNTAIGLHKMDLSQNQYDALVSFAYNTGVHNLTKMLAGCNDGKKFDFQKIPERMKLYNKSKGKILPGLTNRRAAEVNLYNSK